MQTEPSGHDLQPCRECRRNYPAHGDECSLATRDLPGLADLDPPEPRSAARVQLANAHPGDFRSPQGLGTFAFLGLVYLAASLLFSIYTGLRYRGVVIELIDETFAGTFQDAIDIENAYAFSDVLDLLGLLVIAVTWLFWMRRLRSNVVALGRHPEHRPAWIFWGWLVPFMNFFRPYQIIRNLWQMSDPEPGPGTRDDPPGFYLAWWVSYVVTTRLSDAIFRSVQEPETLEQLQSLINRFLFLDLVELVGLVLAVMVIRTLTARQIEAGARLGKSIAEAGEVTG